MSWVLRTHAMDVISCHRVGWSFKGIRASSSVYSFHFTPFHTPQVERIHKIQDTLQHLLMIHVHHPTTNHTNKHTQRNATQRNPNPNPNLIQRQSLPTLFEFAGCCAAACAARCTHTCVLRAAASVRAALLHCWNGRVATVTD